MKRIKGFIHTISAILAVLVLITSLLVGGGVGGAYASASANGEYTDVLDDLHKDETFDMREYPAVDNDYSLDVFQIAESTSGELFIYVYQPSANVKQLTATEINMSFSDKLGGIIDENDDSEITTSFYSLTLLNRKEVFAKYLVNGVTVSGDKVRYYNISSISRPWDINLDGQASGDNTGNSKAYRVGKCFSACTVNGNVVYECEEVKVVRILSPYTGYVRYGQGFFACPTSCDSHYVVFSTDLNIENIYEAKVAFEQRDVIEYAFVGEKYREWVSKEVVINDKETVDYEVGLWGVKYSWTRIKSVEQFRSELSKNGAELSSAADNALKSNQWVFCFYETDYEQAATRRWVEVAGVTILQLKFLMEGKVYNLGTVSDRVTGPEEPSNPIPQFDLLGWLADVTGIPKEAWIAILCLIPIAIALPILSVIFPVVGRVVVTAVQYVFIGVWWIISAPFKGLWWLCKKIFRLED